MKRPRTIKKWCLLRDDDTVKMVIKMKMKEINQKQLLDELEIDVMNFRHYLDNTQPRAVTQYDIWRVANKLGIRLGVKIEFK